MDNGKQKRVPLGANPNTTQKVPREKFVNHPEFMPMFQAAMIGQEFPHGNIPDKFKEWLLVCLKEIPFPLFKMPFEGYKEMIALNPNKYSFGLLQKAIDIIYNSKPSVLFSNDVIFNYMNVIEHLEEMKQIIFEIQDPIKQDIIDKLILKQAPSILKG